MAVISKKVRKTFTKEVGKLARKHGPEIALGLVTALVSSVAGIAAVEELEDSTKKRGKSRGKNRKK